MREFIKSLKISNKLEEYAFIFYFLPSLVLPNISKIVKVNNIVFGLISVPFLSLVLIKILEMKFVHNSFLFWLGFFHVIYSILVIPNSFFFSNPLYYILSDTYRWIVVGFLLIYFSNKDKNYFDKFLHLVVYLSAIANFLILFTFIISILVYGKYIRVLGNTLPLFYWIGGYLGEEKNKNSLNKILLLISGIIGFLNTVFSLVRLAVLLNIIFVFYIFLTNSFENKGIRMRRMKLFLRILLIFMICLFMIYELYPTPFVVFFNRLTNMVESGSVIQRSLEVRSIMEEINNKIMAYGSQFLVLGKGPGALYNVVSEELGGLEAAHHAHFSPILIFFQRGIIGLMIGLFFWLSHGYLTFVFIRPKHFKMLEPVYLVALFLVLQNFVGFLSYYAIYSVPIDSTIVFSALWNLKYNRIVSNR